MIFDFCVINIAIVWPLGVVPKVSKPETRLFRSWLRVCVLARGQSRSDCDSARVGGLAGNCRLKTLNYEKEIRLPMRESPCISGQSYGRWRTDVRDCKQGIW